MLQAINKTTMNPHNEAVLIRKQVVEETLAQAPVQGKKLLEPLNALAKEKRLPINILEDDHVDHNEAEIHHHEDNLWYCLEGEVNFVYGGEMIDPWFKKLPDGTEDKREVKANEMKDGTREVLKPGDWLWIPAGVPHQHTCSGTARMVIIKIPKTA